VLQDTLAPWVLEREAVAQGRDTCACTANFCSPSQPYHLMPIDGLLKASPLRYHFFWSEMA